MYLLFDDLIDKPVVVIIFQDIGHDLDLLFPLPLVEFLDRFRGEFGDSIKPLTSIGIRSII